MGHIQRKALNMPASEAQKRANAKYRRKHVKQVVVSFYPKETDVFKYLQTKGNKSGYIKDLIAKDMQQNR